MPFTRKNKRKGECVLCHKENCVDPVCESIIDIHGYYIREGNKTVLKITDVGIKKYEKKQEK